VLTVNNFLFQMRSAKFFAQTLKELEIKRTITVVDNYGPGMSSGSGYGGVGEGTRQLPRGFPPTGLYQLVVSAGEGYVLAAKGPHDVYYRRTVVPTDRQAGLGVPFAIWDRQQELLEYLAALAQIRLPEARQVFSPANTIAWQDDERFSREVDQRLEAQADSIQAFVNAAEERGFKSLAGIKLRIVPQVEDQRVKATGPLPAVSPRELVLQ
jgi:hypothetical protein